MSLIAEVVVVTGASRGIGQAIAARFVAGGWRVAAVARSACPVDGVLSLAADLRDPAAPRRILDQVEQALGSPSAIVNNAGTAPSDKFETTADAVLDEVLDLHVRAPFRLLRALAPAWKQAGRGTALQIASTAGLRGYPFTAAYAAAKHAMVGLTRALAAEWHGTPLRALALCPGFVDMEITRAAAQRLADRSRIPFAEALGRFARMNRIGRLHTPAEIAEHAFTALSRANGTVLDLDHEPPLPA